jgi:hypothetical protein
MGIKPSPAMKRLFRQIQERDGEDGNVLDFTAFREAVDSRSAVRSCASRNFFASFASWKPAGRKEAARTGCC